LLETDRHMWWTMALQIDSRLRATRRSQGCAAAQGLRGSLTARERQVLRGIFQGLTNKQIGFDIGVSESGVKATVQRLFRKTQVQTRAQLVRVVIEGGWGPSRGLGEDRPT